MTAPRMRDEGRGAQTEDRDTWRGKPKPSSKCRLGRKVIQGWVCHAHTRQSKSGLWTFVPTWFPNTVLNAKNDR